MSHATWGRCSGRRYKSAGCRKRNEYICCGSWLRRPSHESFLRCIETTSIHGTHSACRTFAGLPRLVFRRAVSARVGAPAARSCAWRSWPPQALSVFDAKHALGEGVAVAYHMRRMVAAHTSAHMDSAFMMACHPVAPPSRAWMFGPERLASFHCQGGLGLVALPTGWSCCDGRACCSRTPMMAALGAIRTADASAPTVISGGIGALLSQPHGDLVRGVLSASLDAPTWTRGVFLDDDAALGWHSRLALRLAALCREDRVGPPCEGHPRLRLCRRRRDGRAHSVPMGAKVPQHFRALPCSLVRHQVISFPIWLARNVNSFHRHAPGSRFNEYTFMHHQ